MMHDHDEWAESRVPHDRRGRQAFHGPRRRHHHPEGAGARAGGRRTGGRSYRGEGRGRGDGRGRGRAQRGDIRAATLLLLAEEPMHGYQLMQAIAERTEGAWRPSPGAIYPTIAQLEDEGLVTVTPDSGRKLVALSQAGRAHVAANTATMANPFTAITEQAGGSRDLRGRIEQVRDAARAVGLSGTDGQIAAAQDILTQARRSLYLILAEDPQPTETETVADPTA